jgi:signal transduction histidine kinase
MESSDGVSLPRVLVVDDQPATLLAIEAELHLLGAHVTRAESGEAALAVLQTAEFALILLDVNLPRMSGLEVAQRLRAESETRETPIIFITAYDQDDRDVLAAYALGAVDFLFKPLRLEALRAKARVFINLSRQAELIREHERREHGRALEAARHAWEEESMRSQMQQLAEQDRRKDHFLAVLGHELRTPLTPLLTGLQLLKHRIELGRVPDEQMARTRDVMERHVEHLIRLVDDILDVARIHSGKLALHKAKVCLQDVVEQAVATSRPLLDHLRHTIVVDVPPEPLIVEGDHVRLVQITANLLNNAARYTPPGGQLRVSCGRVDEHVDLFIQDNGIGIATEALSELFEPFTQEGRLESSGLGLGLAIVRRLVLLHGGRVEARSGGPGLGSEFVVRLPLTIANDRPVDAEFGGTAP